MIRPRGSERRPLGIQLNDQLVEPNSALGIADNYLLKRCEPLTLFLRKAGTPLDNNVYGLALKREFASQEIDVLQDSQRSLRRRHAH